jgi:hypothetical protein
MLTIYNDKHALHQGRFEMFRGELVPCVEVPARSDFVLQELKARRLCEVGVNAVNAVNVLDGFCQRAA